ncbi:hypothetical protein HMPREF6485_2563 [Segatella buccae ATCC 33574]|uniref:Uncharacterized protein n=1 Tax=Segatella buccae ATCC 33574 TaxID=873513 RepID=E6KAC7_9BACT|nr:hypothetical protein HMPREF6485_2563 [Segatella buccae ATCC 33574]
MGCGRLRCRPAHLISISTLFFMSIHPAGRAGRHKALPLLFDTRRFAPSRKLCHLCIFQFLIF